MATAKPIGFTSASFEFLEALEANNAKAWFDPRKDDYQALLRAPFERTLTTVTDALADSDAPLRGGAETMFRIHRDVRFSKNKAPYKLNVSGLLSEDGVRNERGVIVYLQLDKAGGFIAAGLHKPDTARLGRLRDAIVDDDADVQAVIAALKAADLPLGGGDSLKSMPRGYAAHAGHRSAALLRLKSWIVQRALSREAWIDGAVVADVVSFVGETRPLTAWLARA